MATTEKVRFKLFDMPCCHHQLCWVNPRLPSYCPACGASVYGQLQTGDHVMIASDAWLKVSNPEPVKRLGMSFTF